MTGELVLIVDDKAENLELVRDVLQGHGYRTLEAATAEEGLALARSCPPDLVLMDIELTGMNGVEALRELKATPATMDIPVVALTAYAMPSDRLRLAQAGFQGYIAKPISITSFLRQVREFCAAV